MMIISQPCAYCGKSSKPRTKGHVLSGSTYPKSLTSAPRITVPECLECKILWESAEPQFRNLLTGIWNSTALPEDSRTSKMMRSFQKCDGKKRACEVLKQIVNTQEGYKIFPLKDECFNLILRRIVRGLSHHHGLESSVRDERVVCFPAKYEIPPAFRAQRKEKGVKSTVDK
jgi:hypothetical protein